MTEREKAVAGYLYDANDDPMLLKERKYCKDLCFDFNSCRPSDIERQQRILKKIIGKIKGDFTITAPFWCDYGYNISIGKNFYTNHNCIILDGAKVSFGDNVFIAPNCCFSTAGHPLDVEQRNQGLEIALPITVGNNVWIGAGVIVLPGVTIGNDTIIGAGSVVNKDIPSGVVAVGNPCRVARAISEQDKRRYPVFNRDLSVKDCKEAWSDQD
ncbi:MAG: sugar O-acetyltransferase [Clostridia bacterium]|nr:sugar O-acetyltransferase [Clostridia bacterium]